MPGLLIGRKAASEAANAGSNPALATKLVRIPCFRCGALFGRARKDEFEHGIRSYGESSRGRTLDFGSGNGGSTPPSPTKRESSNWPGQRSPKSPMGVQIPPLSPFFTERCASGLSDLFAKQASQLGPRVRIPPVPPSWRGDEGRDRQVDSEEVVRD